MLSKVRFSAKYPLVCFIFTKITLLIGFFQSVHMNFLSILKDFYVICFALSISRYHYCQTMSMDLSFRFATIILVSGRKPVFTCSNVQNGRFVCCNITSIPWSACGKILNPLFILWNNNFDMSDRNLFHKWSNILFKVEFFLSNCFPIIINISALIVHLVPILMVTININIRSMPDYFGLRHLRRDINASIWSESTS